MTNVIRFPAQIRFNHIYPLPRQRVFYIGHRYVGPMLCQDIQHLYLKRKGRIKGIRWYRWWSMITYAKYDESDKKPSSMELEECKENDVLEMLEMFNVRKEVTIDGLREMGWNGTHTETAEVIYSKFDRKGD